MYRWADKKSRAVPAVTGLVMLGVGLWCVYSQFTSPDDSPGPQRFGCCMSIVGPLLIIGGGVALVRGLTSGAKVFSSRTALVTGLLMLAVAGLPWLYGLTVPGAWPGDEAAGMLLTILLFVVGLPGLFLTVAGLLWRGWEG